MKKALFCQKPRLDKSYIAEGPKLSHKTCLCAQCLAFLSIVAVCGHPALVCTEFCITSIASSHSICFWAVAANKKYSLKHTQTSHKLRLVTLDLKYKNIALSSQHQWTQILYAAFVCRPNTVCVCVCTSLCVPLYGCGWKRERDTGERLFVFLCARLRLRPCVPNALTSETGLKKVKHLPALLWTRNMAAVRPQRWRAATEGPNTFNHLVTRLLMTCRAAS